MDKKIKQINNMKKDIERALNKLSLVDRGLVARYINDESLKIMNDIAVEVDRCILAMLIEQFEDKSLKELNVIADGIADMREEQELKQEELRKKYPNRKEREKMVTEMSEKMYDRAYELVVDGTSQNNAIKTLQNEFKGLPKQTIVNNYKTIKEDYKAKQKALNDTKEEVVDIPLENLSTEKLAEIIVNAEPKETPKSKFKVKTLALEVEGEHLKYFIKDNTVTVRDKPGTLDGVKYEKMEEVYNKYNDKIKELEETVKRLKNERNEIKEVFYEFVR